MFDIPRHDDNQNGKFCGSQNRGDHFATLYPGISLKVEKEIILL